MNAEKQGKEISREEIIFEQTFGDFLQRHEYDDAEAALFQIVRSAYRAGWLAAMGSPLAPEPPEADTKD